MKWQIEYDNDVGPMDEGFWEWWNVTDGSRSFRADDEQDATWLCEFLNQHDEPNAHADGSAVKDS